MVARRLAAGLASVLLCACSAKESGAAAAAARSAEEASAPEVDVAAQLQLDRRRFPLTVWTAYVVQQEYFDKERFDPREQFAEALRHLGLNTPEFFAAVAGDTATVTVADFRREFSLAGLSDLASVADRLEEVLAFVQDSLRLDAEATHKVEYAAINGMLAPLDPHTILLTPEEHTDLGVKTRGQFGGIGAEIREDERRIRIVKVLANSPAAAAGLKDGDLLLQIDKQSTINLRSSDAQVMLRGPVDTKVTIKVQRGQETLTLTITRKIIRVDSVTSALLPGKIAYLEISTFQENTGEQVRKAIAELTPKGEALRGLVLDLRDNSGGLLTQAVEVVDALVAEGELVIVRSAMGREAEDAAPEVNLPADAAVVALINEDSASAAEIVSGGVKALGRGVVIGRPSFGKGTVQLLKPQNFYGRELALKMTIAEYRVAGDTKIQTVGVRPDLALYPVELSDIVAVANYFDTERFERRRESTQVAHLPSAKHEAAFAGKAAAGSEPRLRYFAGRQGTPLPRPAEGPAALGDPEVQIARDVADALAGLSDSKQRAARLASLTGEIAAREDQAIAAGIAATKIDWTGALEASSDPTLALRARVVDDKKIAAGQPFTLRVEVTNNGAEAAERVHVITDCLRDELDGIELLLGRIEPGATVTRDVRLYVMAWHTDLVDTLRVDVHAGEPGPAPDATATVQFDIAGLPRPRFAYDYWIVDDPELAATAPQRPKSPPIPGEPPFTVKGNGDGVLQPGEQVLLALEIRNDSGADSSDARALIHNLSGAQVLLEEGFLQLGKIAAKGTVRGAFGLSVSEQADPAKPVELEVIVADVVVRESVRHKFDVPLGPPASGFVAAPARVVAGEEPVRLYNAADSHSRPLAELSGGTALDILGSAGGWSAVAAGPGRRAWLPSDLVKTGGPAGKGAAKWPDRPALLVQPPVIEVDAVAPVNTTDVVEIRGTARHEGRVRDVVVAVKPPGTAQVERKLDYRANPAHQGDAARRLEFSAQVPLAPGSNRILITARDGDDIEATREVWVFRP
ncbi:MXAN_5808 family serine peptidase [Nannocystis sp. SCPEA4]|uniref:MXAN_5808 family serine peptidase n=1 Tax=Nannocystis sp. SCPEA4 TaxID=2996787 RepID=UPI002270B779|nr:MXAN_5808 family serine peptidase [Nannocystis sp. SCPEA4]MCY1061342.1 S41 family peptidase [Nannocystis sp. SCPEA4]